MASSHNVDTILTTNLPLGAVEELKFCRPDSASRKKEKEPKLPADCRIPIFKFLPTSELVRFVSKSLPLLGEYWSHELKFVVEQRLPFELYLNSEAIPSDVFEEQPLNLEFALSDCLRNKIADIKHPDQFQFSPLCELTEHAHLPAKLHAIGRPLSALFGKELLAPLINLRSLKLAIFRKLPGCSELPLDFASLSPNIQRLLSQVESLELFGDPFYQFSLNTFLRGLESLKKLEVSVDGFCAAMPVMVPFKRLFERHSLPHDGTEMLARLESLCISGAGNCYGYSAFLINAQMLPMRPILHFLFIKAVQLRELSLPLYGEVSEYVSVFRAMPKLGKLALDLRFMESNGRIEVEEPITSVTDVSIFGAYNDYPACQERALLAFLAKFPNVRTFAVEVNNVYHTLQLVSEVLSLQLFPNLDRLKCFAPSASLCQLRLLPFLENSKLPFVVDLSSRGFQRLADEPDFLAALYGTLKTNPVQFLLMKGPFHPVALNRLEEIIAEDRKITKQSKSKVLAWTAKDFPEQPLDNLPDVSDVKISGVKNAGTKNGKDLSIRICHQHMRVTSHII